MRLDDVVVGKVDFRAVIDEIADEADRLITVLRRHNGSTVDLSQPVSVRRKRGRPKVGHKSRAGGHATATSDVAKPKRNARAERRTHRINRWMSVGTMAVPSPRGPHQAGQRLRPPAWSFSRKGLPRIRRPPCHPATQKTSTSAATSSINTDEGVGRSASMSGSCCDTAFSLNASSPSLYDERLTRSFRKCPSVPLSTYNPTLP